MCAGRFNRPCAVDCVKDVVLTELRRQFEECGCDLDRQYNEIRTFEYFFADVIEPGRVYEVGYPRCLCPQVDAGSWTLRPIANAPAKASSMSWRSCCRQGHPRGRARDRVVRAVRNAVSGSLSGSSLRRLATPGRVRCAGVGCRWPAGQNKNPEASASGFFNRVFSRQSARIDQHSRAR